MDDKKNTFDNRGFSMLEYAQFKLCRGEVQHG